MKRQVPPKALTDLRRKSEEVSRLLKQLSHPQRLLILCSLAEGEKSVGEIEEACGASQSAVSQFLKSLRLDDIIDARRDGQFVFYKIKDDRTLALMKSLYEIFC